MTRIHNFIILSLIISAAIIGVSFLIAEATSEADIIYPATELGGCKDKTACFAYCDNPEHRGDCVAFAAKHNLLPPEELARAQKFEEIGGIGPGGCNSEASCEAYCNDVTRIHICIKFGEDNGLLKGRELEEAKRVKEFIDAGGRLPGGCTNKKSCEEICENPGTKEQAIECFETAKEMRLLPPDFDDEKAERMISLIKEDKVDFGKMRRCEALDRGEAIDPADLDTCMNVAVELGLMKEGERNFARQMMLEGGPKGCRGRGCQQVCEEDPEACLKHFEEKGIALPAEAQERMREGLEQMKQALAQAPPEVLECLRTEIGADVFAELGAGTLLPSEMAGLGPKIGNYMQGCFAKGSGGEGFPGGPGGFPGGDEAMEQCMTEAGLSFPPTAPPTAAQQRLIQECVTRLVGEGGGFPGGPPGGGFPGATSGTGVRVEEGDNGLKIGMTAAGGIQEFSIKSQGGSPYSGGLSNCPKQDAREVALQLPLKITIIDCEGETHEFDVTELGSSGTGGGGQGGFPGGPGGFPGGQGFPGGDEAMEQCMTEAGLSFPPTAPPTAAQQRLIQECVTRLVGEGGGFPGAPGEFPGAPGEFPEGFEPREGFVPGEEHEGFPAEGFVPPEGVSPEQFQQQFQQQNQQQFNQQFQQQYQQQCIAAGGSWNAATNNCETPSGYQPPSGSQPPPGSDPASQCTAAGGTWDGNTCQPPGGGFLYLPSPQARFNPPSLLGFFAQILLGIQ